MTTCIVKTYTFQCVGIDKQHWDTKSSVKFAFSVLVVKTIWDCKVLQCIYHLVCQKYIWSHIDGQQKELFKNRNKKDLLLWLWNFKLNKVFIKTRTTTTQYCYHKKVTLLIPKINRRQTKRDRTGTGERRGRENKEELLLNIPFLWYAVWYFYLRQTHFWHD